MPKHQPDSHTTTSPGAAYNLPDGHLRTIFENTPIGVALVGLDGHPLAVNPAILRITGHSEQEILSKRGLDLAHPDEWAKATEEMGGLVEGKYDSFQTEARFVRKNGEVYWARQNISIVRDPDCSPVCIIVMVEDISEQKRVSAELEESQKRFRTMFDTAAVGIGMMGLDRRLIDANPALCKMFGMSYTELVGQMPAFVTYPEDYTSSTQQYLDLLSGNQDTYWGERRYIRKNGEFFWASVTMSVVRDELGKPLYLIGMLVDIDQQKKVLAQLQESQARFQAMFDNVSVGMAMMNLDRKVITMNTAAQRLIGYSFDEITEIDPAELALPEDRQIGSVEFSEVVAGKRDGLQMEKRYVRQDGTVFWARVTYSLVRGLDGKPEYLVGLIEDINEQKTTAEKLTVQEKEYRQMLEQRVDERTSELMKANMRLVAEIEHRQRAEEALAHKAVEEAITAERTRLARDLHDAVTQTLFSASLIAEVLPELWEVDPKEALKTNEELRQLTRGALAEMRTLLLELRPAALTQARFPDLIKQLSEAIAGRSRLLIHLNVDGDYELPPDVKVVFYRVAQECLNNVVKYSRATQVDITVSLECCNVLMEIRDNGIGFDPSAIKPTSLGMRIMHERAESIRGNLNITSQPGLGTTISLYWNEDESIPISSIPTRGAP